MPLAIDAVQVAEEPVFALLLVRDPFGYHQVQLILREVRKDTRGEGAAHEVSGLPSLACLANPLTSCAAPCVIPTRQTKLLVILPIFVIVIIY